jgi:hypothetical protein
MKEENQVVGFDAVKATAQTVLASVKEMVVTTEVEAQAATLKRDEISKVLKLVEARRVDLVKPIDDSKKVIQAEAKGVSDPLEKAKADLFSKVSKWQTEQRMIAEAAARKEREEAAARLAATMADDDATAEDVERVTAHVEIAAKPVKLSKSLAPMKTRETWKYNLVDFAAFVKWCVDTKQINYLMVDDAEFGRRVRAAAENNPIREAAGMEIYSEVGAG